jgi:hypothetical protein
MLLEVGDKSSLTDVYVGQYCMRWMPGDGDDEELERDDAPKMQKKQLQRPYSRAERRKTRK